MSSDNTNYTKQQKVISRFCKLATKVNAKVYAFNVTSDCFCKDAWNINDFKFDEEIFEFIENAVNKAIEENKKEKSNE